MMHLIRHGQSEFNLAQEKFGHDPGIRDAPLTPRGFEQARAAGAQLAGHGVTSIIVSPYTRALQTASTIADVIGATLHIEPLVGERRIYSCDIGSPLSRLQASWARLDFSAVEKEHWWPGENETQADVTRRVMAFKDKWRPLSSGGGFALVSHWYFIHMLTGRDMANGEVVFHKIF